MKYGDGSDTARYWIGKVIKLQHSRVVSTFTVHWFEPYDENRWMTAKYATAYKPGRRSNLAHPWKDDVETDSIIVYFPRFPKPRFLPVAVQKKLRRESTTST